MRRHDFLKRSTAMAAGFPLFGLLATREASAAPTMIGKYFPWQFVVDFAGGGLAMLGDNVKVEAVITASGSCSWGPMASH